MRAQQKQDGLEFALAIFANHSKRNREQIVKNLATGVDLGAILMQVELAREFDEAVREVTQGRGVNNVPPLTVAVTEQLNNLSVHTDEEYKRWHADYEREMELYAQ